MFIMRKYSILVLIALIMALVPLSGCTKSTESETVSEGVIHLSYASYFPPVHQFSILQEEYCKEIEEKTDGRVQITYHGGGELLSGGKMYDGIVGKTADMGISAIAYTRGRFPVTELFMLPQQFSSCWQAGHVLEDFLDKYKPAEWDEVQLLFTFVLGGLNFYMVDKPVHTLEDLQGMKIGVTGNLADTVSALGAVPQSMEMADCYVLLSKRVIDGTAQSFEAGRGWKLAEVTKYITGCELSVTYPFYVMMSKDKWNSLPEDIKEIITDISKDYAEKFRTAASNMNLEGADYIVSMESEIIFLTSEEEERWKEMVQPVINDYVEGMVAAGYTKEDVLEWIDYINERITYWTEQETKSGKTSELEYIRGKVSQKP